MELHPIRTEGRRKEFQCDDCGHVYLVSTGQQSSRCEACGNIAFHAVSSRPLIDLARGPMELLRERVLQRMGTGPVEAAVPATNVDPLSLFQAAPDGARVQSLLVRYQVEWQLWAMVVKHFGDPAYHMAYLSQAAMARELDKASERYREHRSVMALLREDQWQAAVADLMLTRLEALAEVQARAEARRDFPLLRRWSAMLLSDSRVLRFAWILLGMALVSRLALLIMK